MPGVLELFDRALRRPAVAFAPAATAHDDDGNKVEATVVQADGRIVAVYYRCTGCCTLIGLCESLRDMLTGAGIECALSLLHVDALLSRHPEVPASRQNRAELAVRVFRAAIEKEREHK